MKQLLVKLNVISIDGETSWAGARVLNSSKIVGNPYSDGTYVHFLYDEKLGDRRDPAREYVVSDSLATVNAYETGALAADKVLTDLTFVTKGKEGRAVPFAKTSGLRVKNIISAVANRTTATYTDVRYEVDAFLTEIATINITLANLVKYANAPKVEFFDDFISAAGTLGTALGSETTLQDMYWAKSGTNGTVKVIAEADPFNGKMELETTATGSSTAIATWRSANFNGALEKTFSCRFALDNITNTEIKLGWYASANDYCYINFDTATNAANIYLASNNNNGGVKRDDSGVDLVAATAVDISVTLKGTSIVALVNGNKVTIANCTARDLDTFVPYLYVDNKAAAETKKLDVDWVDISHYRV